MEQGGDTQHSQPTRCSQLTNENTVTPHTEIVSCQSNPFATLQ